MTTFYFVRHGKTELNKGNCFQGGGIDSPLLPEGVQQARELGRYLSDTLFDTAVVSTQKRAMGTANYLLTENRQLNGLTLGYHDGLRELGFGEREGQKVDLSDPQTIYLREQPHLYDPSAFNGETYDALLSRSLSVIERLEAAYPQGNVLVVAHGVVLLVLINYLMGEEKSGWRKNGPLDNTSLTVLQKTAAGTRLQRFNDTAYRAK